MPSVLSRVLSGVQTSRRPTNTPHTTAPAMLHTFAATLASIARPALFLAATAVLFVYPLQYLACSLGLS